MVSYALAFIHSLFRVPRLNTFTESYAYWTVHHLDI